MSRNNWSCSIFNTVQLLSSLVALSLNLYYLVQEQNSIFLYHQIHEQCIKSLGSLGIKSLIPMCNDCYSVRLLLLQIIWLSNWILFLVFTLQVVLSTDFNKRVSDTFFSHTQHHLIKQFRRKNLFVCFVHHSHNEYNNYALRQFLSISRTISLFFMEKFVK